MTNPTSNFNWQMPTSSDLVTDLPADFEVFGQAVDTSLADLKGGTTGQVLSKATNADMDFTWVAADDTNAIQNAIVDAKGDLIAATANDTPARLAVGADGSTLVANSAAATGLSWAGQPYAQPVLNSAFQVWQRGTSLTGLTTAKSFLADRWFANTGSGTTSYAYSRTTSVPTSFQYGIEIKRTASNTGTAAIYLQQDMETVNSIPYAGKTVTFSFYAKAGANYSGSANALNAVLISGTGTDQTQYFAFLTGQATVATGTTTLTTSWQRFSFTGTVASNATQLGVQFNYVPSGTAGADDSFSITGVQIDLGSVALPFKTYAGTIQGEIAACQRYYYRITPNITGFPFMGFGQAISTTVAQVQIKSPVSMRIAPTAVETTATASNYGVTNVSGTALSCSSLPSFFSASSESALINFTVASGLVAGSATQLLSNNTTATYIGISAEL